MQKFIAKYGLAAHLAILAVAPLFLFPFFGDGAIATTLLWLCLPAAAWTFLQPSVRRGEMLHDARARVASGVFRDHLFWVLLVAVVFCGIRALNTGIAMVYDAETAKWVVASPSLPLISASVGGTGHLPFAGSLACMVLVLACRHALGRSARQAYFLISSALAGTAAALALFMANMGNPVASAAVRCPYAELSYVGVAFSVHAVCGVVAAVSVLEKKWNHVVPLLVMSVGFTAGGAFAFAPAYVSAIFLGAWLLVFGYAFCYALCVIRGAAEFKTLVVVVVSLLCGWVLVAMTTPSAIVSSRVEALLDRAFLPDWYESARRAVSALSVKAWMASPWTGTGVGSFAIDVRFNATPSDWAAMPAGLVAPPFGWLKLLTERGIVGVAMMALPLILMLGTYFVRLVGWVMSRTAPQAGCWAAPAVLAAVASTAFLDCSYLRVDVLMSVAAVLALSASTFPKSVKGGKNG